MAKKAAGDGKLNKSEAVRQALAAGIDNPTEGSKHIKEKLGLDVTAQVFSTIKSLTNKKQKGKKKAGKTAAFGGTGVGNGFAGNPADLARGVKSLVEQFGATAVTDMAKVFA